MNSRNRILIGNGKHLNKENNGGGKNKDGKKNNVYRKEQKQKNDTRTNARLMKYKREIYRKL